MYEIVIEDEFSAAHFLKLYDGSWEPRHGHMFRVAVTMRSKELDSIGVVTDFEILKPALKKTLAEFHEKSFNEHPDFKSVSRNPSTENIARIIHDRLTTQIPAGPARITQVTVWETPDASATYFPDEKGPGSELGVRLPAGQAGSSEKKR
jgi:6-pyruvoyltetrahydropterin/6-carboxytetrahydropterin synthase